MAHNRKAEGWVKVFGLTVLFAYTLSTLGVWANANRNGYTYFQAGEPVKSIKYMEWAVGGAALIIAAGMVKEELDDMGY